MKMGLRISIPFVDFKAVFISATIIVIFLNFTPKLGNAETYQKCDGLKCITGVFNQSSCPEGTIYQEKVAVGCCPACVKFRTLNEECEDVIQDGETPRYKITEENGVFISQNCAPGLLCNTDSINTCIIDTGKCDSYQYLDKPFWHPVCEPDGKFSPVQQKGDIFSGRWFCYTPIGKRIFGQAWCSNAGKMTCACSLEAELTEVEEKRTDISLHCNEWGNYDQLQCDNGICWCSDTQTGVPQTVAVPEQMLALLPCYLQSGDGYQYLRACESAAVAAGRIQNILEQHGTTSSNLGVEKCDPDGSYGSYQIMKDQVRCTWKDGSIIGGYATAVDQVANVNCNCAKDSKLFEASGVPLYLTCGGNGNYNPSQVSEEKQFCVDSDGYPTTDPQDKVVCPPSV